MSPADLSALLARLRPGLDALAEPWTIIGSAALVMQGAAAEAPDLDILTTVAGAKRLERAWAGWRARDFAPNPEEPLRSRFSRYVLPEGVAEVMGDLQFRKAGVWRPVVVDEVVRRVFAGGEWPMASVAAQRRIMLWFGRPKDLEKLSRLAEWRAEGARP